MDDIITVLNHFVNAIKLTKDAILSNWESFLVIAIIYTGIIVLLCRLYYKHKEETLEDTKKVLDMRLEEVKKREAITKQQQDEYDRMKAELESQDYEAYLLSRGIQRRNLNDAEIFQ